MRSGEKEVLQRLKGPSRKWPGEKHTEKKRMDSRGMKLKNRKLKKMQNCRKTSHRIYNWEGLCIADVKEGNEQAKGREQAALLALECGTSQGNASTRGNTSQGQVVVCSRSSKKMCALHFTY